MEHRWLHNSTSRVKKGDYRIKIGKARICKEGKDLTVVSMSYMTVEALKAAEIVLKKFKIKAEIIDLRSIKPLDWKTIFKSVDKTGRLLVLDTGFTTGSVAGEIIAKVSMKKFYKLKCAPMRLAMPDIPEPTSFALTKNFHITSKDIIETIMEMFKIKKKIILENISKSKFHDQPGEWFKGPF